MTRFIRYTAVGAFATAVHYGVLVLCQLPGLILFAIRARRARATPHVAACERKAA